MKKAEYPEVLNRLDQAYDCWEEQMWVMRVKRHLCKIRNPNYVPIATEVGFPIDGTEQARKLLLSVVKGGNPETLLPAFRKDYPVKPDLSFPVSKVESVPQDEENPDFREISFFATWDMVHFPYYVARWNACSRRIFYLPEDLSLQLEATSLKKVTARDLRLPFDSFAIALEKPIEDENGLPLDFFLLSKFTSSSFAYFGLSSRLTKQRRIDPGLRIKIDHAMRTGNNDRFARLAQKIKNDYPLLHNWAPNSEDKSPFEGDESWDCDLESLFSNERVKPGHWVFRYDRILMGLSFYLQMLGSSVKTLLEPLGPSGSTAPLTKYGAALYSPDDVCKVQNIAPITDRMRETLRRQASGRGGWELDAGFRQGYWHRPWGTAKDPGSTKTEWTRPTMYRRDRLPEGTLPLGSGKIFPK